MNGGVSLLWAFRCAIHFRQRGGEIDQSSLVAVAGGVQEAAEKLEGGCLVPHLFSQLSLCGAKCGLSRNIACASGDLELTSPNGRPILLDQDHEVIVIDGDDGDGSLVAHHLTIELITTVFDEEALDTKDVAGEQCFDLSDLEAVHQVFSGRNRDRGAEALDPRRAPRQLQGDP